MNEISTKTFELNPFTPICRGCLTEGGEMKNIYEWGLSEDFYLFTDVPLTRCEGMTELLCPSCEEQLNGCKKFRRLCQTSDAVLKDLKSKAMQTSSSEQRIPNIDIRQTLTDNTLLITISTSDMTSKINFTCPYKCQTSYLKQKDLLSHLVKNHRVSSQFSLKVKFHCPHKDCPYNLESNKGKYFSGRKFLNQHLNKKHDSKNIKCETCKMNFYSQSEFTRHLQFCSKVYKCEICHSEYKCRERLLVHLKRNHPVLHRQFKQDRKVKRPPETVTSCKKRKEFEFLCNSPKRHSGTQTLKVEDMPILPWECKNSSDDDRNYTTIETQTVFEDLLSLKSQNSEDDSMYFAETVLLSDIQTQTFPLEFGLSTKETNTSGTQSPDLSIKETQTCVCHYESPRLNFKFDSVTSSPSSANLTSTETQTSEFLKSDVMFSCNSAETQTCFDENDL